MKLAIGTRQMGAVIDQLARWFPARETQLRRLQEQCHIGLQIELAPMRRRSTDAQRGAYWAGLHELGRHLGYSARESETLLHEVILAECYGVSGSREIRAGGKVYQWPRPAERSSRKPDGGPRDVETYSELIETLLRFAAEYGCVIEIERAA
jgi:hypothetical protein